MPSDLLHLISSNRHPRFAGFENYLVIRVVVLNNLNLRYQIIKFFNSSREQNFLIKETRVLICQLLDFKMH